MKPHIIITEVLAQFTSVNTSASSALQFLNGLSSVISLILDIDLKNNHMLQFTRKAISAHMIVKPKYEDTWNVGILFDYWREKGSNRKLTNIELQTKLTSLLMTICSIRPAEIEGISLRHSVICEQTDKTRDRIVRQRAIFFDQLKRIDNNHGRSIRDNKYVALWSNEDITIPAKRGQISLRLKKLLDMMGIKGKQAYSFNHSVATQQIVMDLDETLLNIYTGHARNSKSTNEYYIFAEILKINEIATKLSDIRGKVECNPISIPTLCGVFESITALYVSYTFFVTSPFNLRKCHHATLTIMILETALIRGGKTLFIEYNRRFDAELAKSCLSRRFGGQGNE
ncbi:MAG: hypothetical protein EZS28_030909 [Streblomastix strix]|uniref:Tyr recombinase domain-containing protein n=1 Tax=Streblomastix strix TaxID=222440 RepID=A0A5J4UTZ0_9EUKA|nr:MAG: hypothetical protein EZS28_030909 [Streblomastix strix]